MAELRALQHWLLRLRWEPRGLWWVWAEPWGPAMFQRWLVGRWGI